MRQGVEPKDGKRVDQPRSVLRVDDRLGEPMEDKGVGARFMFTHRVPECESQCQDREKERIRYLPRKRPHPKAPAPSPRRGTTSCNRLISYSERNDCSTAPNDRRSGVQVEVSHCGRPGYRLPRSIASHGWHNIVITSPELSRIARSTTSGRSLFTNPRPIGAPGATGFSVTGTSQSRRLPGLQGSLLSGWYGLRGAPRWSTTGRTRYRRFTRPGSTEESTSYPRSSAHRRIAAVKLKFGARNIRGLAPAKAVRPSVASSNVRSCQEIGC